MPLYYDGRLLYDDFSSGVNVYQPVAEATSPYISQCSNGSLVRWPTENVSHVSHWTFTAVHYTSMRSLLSVVLRQFFNNKTPTCYFAASPNTTQTGHKIIANRRPSNVELKLTTIYCKCSQTYRVSQPSSSQNLAAKCASKKKLYRIVDRQSSNLTLQQFTASARKHSEYLYPVVHKTLLQSVQAKKRNKQQQQQKRIDDRLPGSFPMFPSFASPSPER